VSLVLFVVLCCNVFSLSSTFVVVRRDAVVEQAQQDVDQSAAGREEVEPVGEIRRQVARCGGACVFVGSFVFNERIGLPQESDTSGARTIHKVAVRDANGQVGCQQRRGMFRAQYEQVGLRIEVSFCC
jgi:hypothetical protein